MLPYSVYWNAAIGAGSGAPTLVAGRWTSPFGDVVGGHAISNFERDSFPKLSHKA